MTTDELIKKQLKRHGFSVSVQQIVLIILKYQIKPMNTNEIHDYLPLVTDRYISFSAVSNAVSCLKKEKVLKASSTSVKLGNNRRQYKYSII